MFKVNNRRTRLSSCIFIANFEWIWQIICVYFAAFEHVNGG